MSQVYVEKTFHIEFLQDDDSVTGREGEWTITGQGPMPHDSRETSNSLSLPVWVAYVDYLNAREFDKDGNPEKRYRLIHWRRTVTTEKEIIHV